MRCSKNPFIHNWNLRKMSYDDFIDEIIEYYHSKSWIYNYTENKKVIISMEMITFGGSFYLEVCTDILPPVRICIFDLEDEYNNYKDIDLNINDTINRIENTIKTYISLNEHKSELSCIPKEDITRCKSMYEEFINRVDNIIEEYQYPAYRVNDLLIVDIPNDYSQKINLYENFITSYVMVYGVYDTPYFAAHSIESSIIQLID